MYVAGDPSPLLGRADVPRRLPLGRRRRRCQPLVRPRHRRPDGAHRQSADTRRPGLAARGADVRLRARAAFAAGALAHGQPAGGRAVVLRLPRLRVRLHRVAEAPHAAEHRDRRRRRRGAPAGRLGGGDGVGQRHRRDPVLHRLLLDTAALLGAVAADEGGVPQGRRADAPGRPRRGRDAPTDPALLGAALRGDTAAVLRGGLRLDLPRRLAAARARLHRRRCAPYRRADAARAAACTSSRSPTWRCCSARWSPTPICRIRPADDDPPPRTQEHPHRPDRGRDLHVHVRHHVRGRGGVRLVSPLDPEIPPVGEEIHLPGPSILPC